jgi:uncharacterized membrane protein YdfJ with MMPL/SSD domain
MMASGTETLAWASAKRPWRTVAIWLLMLVTAVMLSSQLLGDALTSSIGFTDQPESAQAAEMIED